MTVEADLATAVARMNALMDLIVLNADPAMQDLADRVADLQALGPRAADLQALGAIVADIEALAADLAGADTIGTVAADIAAIQAIAADLATVLAAPASAAAAAASATDSETAKDASETAQTATEAARDTALAARDTAEGHKDAAALSAATAVAANSVAVRMAFRNRFGLLPAPGALVPLSAGIADGLTLTRATVGRYVTEAGLDASAAIDGARIEHDPVTSEPIGLLVEPGVTNHATHAIAFDNGAYQKLSGGTVTPDFALAPDGNMTADLWKVAAAASQYQIRDTGLPTVLDEHACLSTWLQAYGAVRKVTLGLGGGAFDYLLGNSARALFDLLTGEISPLHVSYGAGGRSGATAWGRQAYPGGLWRVWVTAQAKATGASGEAAIIIVGDDSTQDGGPTNFPGDSASGVICSGFQWEPVATANSGPSSFILTTGATATRAADLAAIDLGAIAAFRAGAYSLLIEARLRDVAGILAEIGQGSTGDLRLEMQAGALHLTDGGAFDLEIASGLGLDASVLVAIRVADGDVAVSLNGAAVVTSAAFSPAGDSDTLQLGADLGGAGGCAAVFANVAVFGPLDNAKLVEISGA